MSKGIFIDLEGVDGSGKATQTTLLTDYLRSQGMSVENISFPRYGETSAALVKDYLNGKFGPAEAVSPQQASIFYAIDRFAAKKQIQEWLEAGKIVISNRYVASNLGHQGGKFTDAQEREKFFSWALDLEYNIFGIPQPDITLILWITPTISQDLVDQKEKREYLNGGKRDIHEDSLTHLRGASEAYTHISQLYPGFQIINCLAETGEMLDRETIQKKIQAVISKYLAINPPNL